MEVSCTYCFNGTENECKDCGDPICADHADAKNECLDAESNKVHVAAAPKTEYIAPPKPKPRKKSTSDAS